jgi:hypothetical protein
MSIVAIALLIVGVVFGLVLSTHNQSYQVKLKATPKIDIATETQSLPISNHATSKIFRTALRKQIPSYLGECRALHV